MSLVSDWLRLVSRWISSEMSTAESSCTKRNSSMRVSSSAMGCSNSRKVVFNRLSILPAPGRASATGTRWRPSATAASFRQASHARERDFLPLK